MKESKFLIGFVVITSSLYLLSAFIMSSYKMSYINREFPMWQAVKENAMNEGPDLDVLLLGDSRLKAGLIPNEMTSKSENYGLGGSSTIEGYYLLKKFLKNNKAPKAMVLSYAPFHLVYHDRFWDRTIKFDLLDDEEIDSVLVLAQKYSDEYIDNGNTNFQYKLPNKYIGDFLSGIQKKRWKTNQLVFKKVKKSKGHFFFGTKDGSSDLNYEAEMNSFEASPLLTDYLERILKLARKNSIKVMWVDMPMNNSSFEKMSHVFLLDYHNYIDRILKENGGEYTLGLEGLSDDNFGDPSHLNSGALPFTLKVDSIIINQAF